MMISMFNQLSAIWIALVWKATWQGGAALLLVLFASRLGRRIPPHVQCWLWRLAGCGDWRS
jgi:hypothetical protein